ncbi:MAG TPA: MBL fold metallo-hydrolase [Candidatus Dormibacteraeota bacterium]|jgi:ribonuclease J
MAGARTTLSFLHTGNPTGLKFVVEHGDSRCLFDFGREHAPGRVPFSLGLRPRPGRELADLIAVGEAQPLPGVYAGDPWDRRTHVFISHMHLDHTGLIGHLGPEVPLYYPAAMEPVREGASSSGYLPWREPVGNPVGDRETIAVGEMAVRFVAVDHDVPGSSGFLVTTPEVTIAFTGDHRWHGLHPELTARFAEEARGADLLIQEGVSLGYLPPDDPPLPTYSEADVIAELGLAAAETTGLLIVNCYGMNRERVAGLAAGCAAAGRTLLMEPQMAAMAGWPGLIGSLDPIRERPRDFCLQLGFESLPLLIDLQPPTGSLYLHSGGAPMGAFDPAQAVLEAWIQRFGLEYRVVTTSGHSRWADIVRMVTTVKPRRVLPVHSRAPEALAVPAVRSFLPVAGPVYAVADILTSPAPTSAARRASHRPSGRTRPR